MSHRVLHMCVCVFVGVGVRVRECIHLGYAEIKLTAE